jgi:hypothetical protein
MTEPMIEEPKVETEEFIDELSDEALDREAGGKFCCAHGVPWTFRARAVTRDNP